MQCDYYDAGRCRSCTLLDQSYDEQLAAKQAHVASLLADHADLAWDEPVRSPDEAFRNKAKMVVTGTVDAPTLGILDAAGAGVDLRGCPLHVPPIRDVLPVLADFVTRASLTPYDIGARRGELKHVLVTASPDGELMVRFVLRSEEAVPRIRKHLAWLTEQQPSIAVVTVNLQPEHKAVLEGEREMVLSEQETLPMRVAGMELLLRPQSFFQTNTEVAGRLYDQARTWVEEVSPRTLWDLYCGVGGFALACAAPGRQVLGVEVSEEAVAAAQQAAALVEAQVEARTEVRAETGTETRAETGAADRAGEPAATSVRFEVGDATTLLRDRAAPELVVVNPPRRGIGDLAAWLDASAVQTVLYSSCNADSLARDLAQMPGLRPVRARLLDMFPHTRHHEVLVLLRR